MSACTALTVVAAVAVFGVVGSVSVAVTETELFIVPAAVGVTTILTVALAPLLIVPKLQVSTPATGGSVHEPCEGVAETNVALAGKVSVSVTAVALAGPALDTVTA